MRKLLGLGCLLAAMIVAIACGSDGGSSNQRSIAGAIDNSVLSKSTLESGTYEVWAEVDGTRVKKGNITNPSVLTEDATYQVDGLTDGQAYEITVYRVVGFDRVSVMSTVVTASSTSGTLTTTSSSKARSKVRYQRQMNMVTTYISKKYVTLRKTSTTTTVTSIVSSVFGSTSVSLETIVSENGNLTDSTGIGLAMVDPVATAAVTQLTFATTAVTTMTATKVSEQKTIFESFTTTMTTATTTTAILTATTDSSTGLNKLVTAAVESSDATTFTSRMQSADKNAASVFAQGSTDLVTALTTTTVTIETFAIQIYSTFSLQVAVAGGVDTSASSAFFTTLSTQTSISQTVIKTQSETIVKVAGPVAGLSQEQQTTAEQNASSGGAINKTIGITITKFGLAHATAYGTPETGNAFTINTLAPVFLIKFDKTLPAAVSSIIDVSITNTKTGASQSLSTVSSKIVDVKGADGMTYYLMVKKSASPLSSSDSAELKPGTTYNYSITIKPGFNVTFAGGSKTGTITTSDITLTLPFDGSAHNTSLVNLVQSPTYNGLSASSDASFYVSSNVYINHGSDTTTYGLIGSSGNLDVRLNGSSTASDNDGASLTVTNSSLTGNTMSGWANGFRVTIGNSFLTTGSHNVTFGIKSSGNIHYTVDNDGSSDGDLPSSSLPSKVTIDVQ